MSCFTRTCFSNNDNDLLNRNKNDIITECNDGESATLQKYNVIGIEETSCKQITNASHQKKLFSLDKKRDETCSKNKIKEDRWIFKINFLWLKN